MIRSLALLTLLAAPSGAGAAEEPSDARGLEAEPVEARREDEGLERHRTPLEALTERMLGSASRAVRFDWRRKSAGLAIQGASLLELNSFSSAKVGAVARVPLAGLMAEVGFGGVLVLGSPSTEALSMTPYRQAGRASRFLLDLGLGYPLAEGVATLRPGFLPAAELVFSANVGFRYYFYPGALDGATPGEVTAAIFAPRLSAKELENLEPLRLPGMQLDDARYDLLAGFTLDVYFQPGLFFSPRVMLGLPLFAPGQGSSVGWWWELTMALGWMW